MLSYRNFSTTSDNYDNNNPLPYSVHLTDNQYQSQFNTNNNFEANNSQFNQFGIDPFASKVNQGIGSNNPFSSNCTLGISNDPNQPNQLYPSNHINLGAGNDSKTTPTGFENSASSREKQTTSETINKDDNRPLPEKIKKAIDSLIATQPYWNSSSEVIYEVAEYICINGNKTQKEFLESLNANDPNNYPQYEKEVKRLCKRLNEELGGFFKTGKKTIDKNNTLRHSIHLELTGRSAAVKDYLTSPEGQKSPSNIEKSQLIKHILKTNRGLEDLTDQQLNKAKKILEKEKERYVQIGSSLDSVITSIEDNKTTNPKEHKCNVKKATSQINKTTSQLRSFSLINENHDQSGPDIDRLPQLFKSRKNQLDPEEMKKFKARFETKKEATDHLFNSLKSKEVFKNEQWHQQINLLNSPIHKNNNLQDVTAPNSPNHENTPPAYDYWYLWVTTNALEKLIKAVQPPKYKKLFSGLK